jgi:hypothetical protein
LCHFIPHQQIALLHRIGAIAGKLKKFPGLTGSSRVQDLLPEAASPPVMGKRSDFPLRRNFQKKIK